MSHIHMHSKSIWPMAVPGGGHHSISSPCGRPTGRRSVHSTPTRHLAQAASVIVQRPTADPSGTSQRACLPGWAARRCSRCRKHCQHTPRGASACSHDACLSQESLLPTYLRHAMLRVTTPCQRSRHIILIGVPLQAGNGASTAPFLRHDNTVHNLYISDSLPSVQTGDCACFPCAVPSAA